MLHRSHWITGSIVGPLEAKLLASTSIGLLLLAAMVPACSNNAAPTLTSKDQAASQRGRGEDGADLCLANAWYGDGECDTFCVRPDPDCDEQEPCASCREICDGTALPSAGCGNLACDCADRPCGENDCGPPPPLPACPGATSPSASCERLSDGSCSWQVADCPEPPPECGPVCAIACPNGMVLDENGCPTCACNPDCTEEQCGPAPGAPSQQCLDGSVSGPVCGRQADGACGWAITECPEPVACGGFTGAPCPDGYTCIDDPRDECDPRNGGADCGGICTTARDRQPVGGACVRNSDDACETDADCRAGGCGGELCYNPAISEGVTTCECSQPQDVGGCGCVAGQCSWYQ